MPLLVTPQRLERKGDLYHQLAALTAAGIGVISALETVVSSATDRFSRPIALRLIQQLQAGATVSEGLSSLGSAWVADFDDALIRAGEQSGRLDACFRLLSEY